jgi:hypothetical protein
VANGIQVPGTFHGREYGIQICMAAAAGADGVLWVEKVVV